MELWQLDGFSYRLHDDARTPVTLYQLADVGARARSGAEGTDGGVEISDQRAPLKVLSDNRAALAQYRWGRVRETEESLDRHGTWSNTGRPAHRLTQGKIERAHWT